MRVERADGHCIGGLGYERQRRGSPGVDKYSRASRFLIQAMVSLPPCFFLAAHRPFRRTLLKPLSALIVQLAHIGKTLPAFIWIVLGHLHES